MQSPWTWKRRRTCCFVGSILASSSKNRFVDKFGIKNASKGAKLYQSAIPKRISKACKHIRLYACLICLGEELSVQRRDSSVHGIWIERTSLHAQDPLFTFLNQIHNPNWPILVNRSHARFHDLEHTYI